MEEKNDLLTHIPEHHRPVVEQFLMKTWVQLAADCYGHYLKAGRGIITLFLHSNTIYTSYLPWSQVQAYWDDAFRDADVSMQNSIDYFVPRYNPANEAVLYFEFADGAPSALIKATQSIFSQVSQIPGVTVPRLRRHGVLTPKDAYEARSRF